MYKLRSENQFRRERIRECLDLRERRLPLYLYFGLLNFLPLARAMKPCALHEERKENPSFFGLLLRQICRVATGILLYHLKMFLLSVL